MLFLHEEKTRKGIACQQTRTHHIEAGVRERLVKCEFITTPLPCQSRWQ